MGYKNDVLNAFRAHQKVIKTIKSCTSDAQLNVAQHLLPLYGKQFEGLIDEDSLKKYRVEQLKVTSNHRHAILHNLYD